MNLGIVSVILRVYCLSWVDYLEQNFDTPEKKMGFIRQLAIDEQNEEVVQMLDYIEKNNLVRNFFN